MESFVPLLGTWQGLERQQQSAYGDAADARAMITFRYDLARTVVVQDYRQVRADGGEFLGHGVFMTADDRVLWWLFDSAGYVPVPAEGGFGPDDELTLTKTTPRGTAVHRWRVRGGELEYRIAVGGPGEEPAPFLAGRYRQVSTH